MKTLTASQVRTDLPRYKRQVQLSGKVFAMTHYEKVVGLLVPVSLVGEWATATEDYPLAQFRLQLTDCWERLQCEVDVFFLTHHRRRKVAFVSPRHAEAMGLEINLPVMEVA